MTRPLTEDVARFRLAYGLNPDEDKRAVWMAQLGHFVLPLPNFKWRRDVINRHDAHHLLTGFPTSPSGELALAAWELGAKCYLDWRARALCHLLMLMGLLSRPKMTYAAYRKGRLQAGAYADLVSTDFLSASASVSRAKLRQ